MPFIAIEKSTGKRIDITKIKNPRIILNANDCVCQLCKEPLMIRAGMIISPHFAHFAHTECKTEYRHHPESQEHREAKSKLAELLKSTYEEYTTANIEYEFPIPEIKRVADIIVDFPSGWRIAHEIQLAKISDRELQERTDDYFGAGIDVIWWLGKSANTAANRKWCIEYFGQCFCLNINEETHGKN